jgi:hypothetical protein
VPDRVFGKHHERRFLKDIYERDAKLLQALNGPVVISDLDS